MTASNAVSKVSPAMFQRLGKGFFKLVEALMAAMLVIMLGLVLSNVILRYGFGTGIASSEELSRTLFVWITFIGAVVATRDGSHLSVDSMVALLPRGGKVFCALLSELIILACCALIFVGTWRQQDVNASTHSMVIGMPMSWVFGVGYVVSLGIGALVVQKLWRIVSGQALDSDLFNGTPVQNAVRDNAKEGPSL